VLLYGTMEGPRDAARSLQVWRATAAAGTPLVVPDVVPDEAHLPLLLDVLLALLLDDVPLVCSPPVGQCHSAYTRTETQSHARVTDS
jgi:hypothetical protein